MKGTIRDHIRYKYDADNVYYWTLLVATSKSSAVAKYGKAKAEAAQVTGRQGSDQSVLEELQEQFKNHQSR